MNYFYKTGVFAGVFDNSGDNFAAIAGGATITDMFLSVRKCEYVAPASSAMSRAAHTSQMWRFISQYPSRKPAATLQISTAAAPILLKPRTSGNTLATLSRLLSGLVPLSTGKPVEITA